jgi:hypothetical protein
MTIPAAPISIPPSRSLRGRKTEARTSRTTRTEKPSLTVFPGSCQAKVSGVGPSTIPLLGIQA